MCCDLCCKELKGWCRSFTKTEKVLCILEAVLLVVLVTFLIFLILHLLACSTVEPRYDSEQPKQSDDLESVDKESSTVPIEDQSTRTTASAATSTTRASARTTASAAASTTTGRRITPSNSTSPHTPAPAMDCSWTPSAKTTAITHYFAESGSRIITTFTDNTNLYETKHMVTATGKKIIKQHKEDVQLKNNVDFIQVDESDGEVAEPMHNEYILSLVKLKPPQSVAFGCILTIISNYWTLTSASCIEAIEEVDSLDSFVIMEDYGTSFNGKIHSIFDVQIHPFYRGTNMSYDLAIIKSESVLANRRAAQLPSILDISMITIGERFNLLGFGAYRSIDRGPKGRRLRKVFAYRLAGAQCAGGAGGGGAWAARHLEVGRAVGRGGAGGAGGALCAGPLGARGLPCNYCGGAPLLRGARLLGLMAHNAQCGVACEPRLYVNVAAVRDWIDAVLDGQ